MKLEKLKDTKPLKAFIQHLYRGDPCFKDTKTDLLDIVCGSKTPFSLRSLQQMVQVKEGERVLCQGVFLCHREQKDVLMVGFFEALPHVNEAVDLLFARAKAWGQMLGCTKMVVGLEGHCNNSLGFSAGAEQSPSFGEVYHPAYYQEYFRQMNQRKLVSFKDSFENVQQQIQRDLPRLAATTKEIVLEAANFGQGFSHTMKRYTDLNNLLFSGHDHYFPRSYEEDAHLFRSMVPLLREDHLLFATKQGTDLGFILWYPDFNQLVSTGKGADWTTVLKMPLQSNHIQRVKVVEIGVDKRLSPPGLILLLLHQAIQRASRRYRNANTIISSWILEENIPSKNISRRYLQEPYKEYYVYEENI